ncbi:MAG: hypothetical protein WBF58_12430, partial [Xanthobacteraceae bacterium]
EQKRHGYGRVSSGSRRLRYIIGSNHRTQHRVVEALLVCATAQRVVMMASEHKLEQIPVDFTHSLRA